MSYQYANGCIAQKKYLEHKKHTVASYFIVDISQNIFAGTIIHAIHVDIPTSENIVTMMIHKLVPYRYTKPAIFSMTSGDESI